MYTTSYEVSKKLWEAGIVFDSNKVFPHNGALVDRYYDEQEIDETFTYEVSGYPAYTCGELMRELQVLSAKHKSLLYCNNELRINMGWFLEDENDFCVGVESLWVGEENKHKQFADLFHASTPEDALGLALIEIRSKSND